MVFNTILVTAVPYNNFYNFNIVPDEDTETEEKENTDKPESDKTETEKEEASEEGKHQFAFAE